MTEPFVYANPGERRNQSRPGWDHNILFEHRSPSGERARLDGAPAVVLAVQRAEILPELTPAPASFGSFPSQGPAAFLDEIV